MLYLELTEELKKRIESQNRIISKQLYFAINSNILNFKDILNLYYTFIIGGKKDETSFKIRF